MTGVIAPHEANEVRLVLAGTKPLATIEKRKQPILYSLAVAMAGTGALFIRCAPTRDSPKGEAIITLPRNKHLIEQFDYLLDYGVRELGVKEFHRRMGRLYGYSEEDIEAFIAAEINCDCEKCRGKQ
jgi:hypothetical protein